MVEAYNHHQYICTTMSADALSLILALIIGLILGLILSGIGFALLMRARLQALREKAKAEVVAERAAMVERLQNQEQQVTALQAVHQSAEADLRKETMARTMAETRLEEERRAAQEKLTLLNEAQTQLADAFKALSADALRQNSQSFVELAQGSLAYVQQQAQERAQVDLNQRQRAIDDLVKPLASSLEKVDIKLQELETSRISAYASLSEQLKSVASTQVQLHQETTNLTKALRAPTVRGRWGEIQLKRVVEIAGMVEHCDFVQQASVETDQGKLRPDMVIKLPNGKNIIVDSKAPLQAYLEALEIEDEAGKRDRLATHARHIRNHLTQLGAKSYWSQFQPAPEFVVLFLPGETFFSAALEQDPGLIEFGVDRSVILATPTTLIALLKAVAYGWRQERVAENTQQVRELGQELYDRTQTFVNHFVKLRRSLNSTVDSFNKAVGSLESRVLVTARKFEALGTVTGGEIETIENIDLTPRQLQSAAAEPSESAQSTPTPPKNP